MYGNTEPKGLKAIYDDLHLHRSTVQTNWSLFLNSYIFHNFRYKLLLESLLNKTPRDHPDFDKLQGNI